MKVDLPFVFCNECPYLDLERVFIDVPMGETREATFMCDRHYSCTFAVFQSKKEGEHGDSD